MNVKQYRLPPADKAIVQERVEKYLEERIIQPSMSAYSNPVFLAPKGYVENGKATDWQMFLNFCRLNNVTVGDSFPLPNITDILDQLGGGGSIFQ